MSTDPSAPDSKPLSPTAPVAVGSAADLDNPAGQAGALDAPTASSSMAWAESGLFDRQAAAGPDSDAEELLAQDLPKTQQSADLEDADGLGGGTVRWQPPVGAVASHCDDLPGYLEDAATLPEGLPAALADQAVDTATDEQAISDLQQLPASGHRHAASTQIALNEHSIGQRVAAWAGLIVLLAAIAVPVWHAWRLAALVPTDEALQKAAAVVGADLQTGDAIAYFPSWAANRPWLFDKLFAQKGLDYTAAVVLGEPIDAWDCDGKTRLWVVATHSKADQLLVAGARQLRRSDVGNGTAVVLFSLAKSTTVFDFSRQLKVANHSIGTTGAPLERFAPCAWQVSADPRYGGGLHQCGSQEWKNSWWTLHEVGNTRRYGIFVHPPFENGTLRLQYSGLPAGDTIAGRFGNRLWAVRHGDEGSATTLRVVVGERQVYVKTVAPDDFGWHPFSVSLGPQDRGQPVAFEVSAAKDAWREAVLDARLLAVGK
ncbi:MAG: hypothetical protein EXR77_19125 [Myxococcales bacterium]|nr:hypothetical protein [Myxococcales bacterium]